MNSAKGSAQIRRNAIILNTPGAHPKDAEKGRVITKRFKKAPRRFVSRSITGAKVLSNPMSQEDIDNWERMNSR